MKRHRHETIDYYIIAAVVLHRNEEWEVGANDHKNLTLSWGAGLAVALSKLNLGIGVGLS